MLERGPLESGRYAEFFRWAQALGFDPDELAGGGELCRYFTLPTFEAGRILSHATEEQRRKRQLNFFHPAIAVRSRLGQGMHDRGEAMTFAAGEIPKADILQGSTRHLPIHVKSVSVLSKTVGAGEMWDVSVRGEVWGLDHMEELYSTLNVGRLILEPGASVVVQGNVFTLLCQELIAGEGSQIRILPTPFSVDFRHGPHHGVDGEGGRDGMHGAHGRHAWVETCILGYRLTQPIQAHEVRGQDGEDGRAGLRGSDGRNGGMAKLAEITIRELTGKITVFAQAGDGGYGGQGGDGGRGGDGGNGGPGYRTMEGILQAGRGGSGGSGGNGGNGGNGGSGGISSNIYVNVPDSDVAKVDRISRASVGGAGGRGGRGGAPGTPGLACQGLHDYENGQPGLAGERGAAGRTGIDGRSRPAPKIFLNEEVDQSQGEPS
jgi:hypothetical protein